MITDEMVECAAKALHAHAWDGMQGPISKWKNAPAHLREEFRRQGRAVLEALDSDGWLIR